MRRQKPYNATTSDLLFIEKIKVKKAVSHVIGLKKVATKRVKC